jgi:dihydrofolate reductase
MHIVVAACANRGIGFNNTIPWFLENDLKNFKKITDDGVVIMGRKTYFSIPINKRPLANRINIVLTKNKNEFNFPQSVIICSSFEEALEKAKLFLREIYIIGGSNLYKEAINHPEIEKIYYTKVLEVFDCDTFFPEIPFEFKNILEDNLQEEGGIKYKYEIYKK